MQNTPISSSSPLFHEVWRIYETSFPEDERRDIAQQKALSGNPRYCLLASHEEGNIVGFISFWRLEHFTFVEHLAVRDDMRGRGLGERMLADFLNGKGLVVMEVERPSGETEERRIGFYRKAGFHLNDFDYIQPPYGPEKSPVHMLLMSHPRPLGGEEFPEVRKEIHRVVYSRQAPLV